MGATGCKPGNLSLQKERETSRTIDAQLWADLLAAKKEQKLLLLLGPAESGKSTIFIQFKMIFGRVAEEERLGFKPIIHSYIISCMVTLIRA